MISLLTNKQANNNSSLSSAANQLIVLFFYFFLLSLGLFMSGRGWIFLFYFIALEGILHFVVYEYTQTNAQANNKSIKPLI